MVDALCGVSVAAHQSSHGFPSTGALPPRYITDMAATERSARGVSAQQTTSTVTIPRFESHDAVAVDMMKAKRPVVFTPGHLADIAVEKWTCEYLAKHARSNKPWTVFASKGSFMYSDSTRNLAGFHFKPRRRKMLMKFQAFNKELQRRIESASRKEAHGGDGATDAGDPTPAKEPPATSSASQGADEATSTSESTETGAGAGAGAGSTTSGRGGVKLGGGDALSELVRIGATLHSCEKDLRGLSKELENLSPTNKVDMKAVMQPLGPAPTDSSATSKKIKRKRKKGGKKRGGYNPNTPAPNERIALFVGLGDQLVEDFRKFGWERVGQLSFACNWGPLLTNMLLIGEQGCVTPMHYDEKENLFAQVQGRKLCVLASPSEFHRLYPYPVGHPADRQSQVNIRSPDLDKFPNVPGVTLHVALLEPGDVLYIPMYWWHQMESPLEATTSLTFTFRAGIVPTSVAIPPISDPGTLVAMRRNIEIMAGHSTSYKKSSCLWTKMDEGKMEELTEEESVLLKEVKEVLMLALLTEKRVAEFLRKLTVNRFKYNKLA